MRRAAAALLSNGRLTALMREMLIRVQMHRSIYVNNHQVQPKKTKRNEKIRNPYSRRTQRGGQNKVQPLRTEVQHQTALLAETNHLISTCGVIAPEQYGTIKARS